MLPLDVWHDIWYMHYLPRVSFFEVQMNSMRWRIFIYAFFFSEWEISLIKTQFQTCWAVNTTPTEIKQLKYTRGHTYHYSTYWAKTTTQTKQVHLIYIKITPKAYRKHHPHNEYARLMIGQSTMEAIFWHRHLIEKYRRPEKIFLWSLLTWRKYMKGFLKRVRLGGQEILKREFPISWINNS